MVSCFCTKTMSFVLLCCEKEGEIASEVGERTKLKKENTYV